MLEGRAECAWGVSYGPRDLRMLIQRANHEHTRRSAPDDEAVLTEDFQVAIKNFTPASLAKVKKSESQVSATLHAVYASYWQSHWYSRSHIHLRWSGTT